jgi:hypothetical protein
MFGGKWGWGVTPTTRLHLIPRLKLIELHVLSLPYIPMAWRLMNHKDNFNLSYV